MPGVCCRAARFSAKSLSDLAKVSPTSQPFTAFAAGGAASSMDVEEHLIRSDRTNSTTGLKGVTPDHGRYKAVCDTPPCRKNHLGMFDTAEEAAQAYLQHYQKQHPEELK